MKLTQTQFLEQNKLTKFFANEEDAINFYRFLKIGDIQTGLLYLINAIEKKIGWYEFNKILNTLPNHSSINDIQKIENLLDSRLDDFIVTPSITGLLKNIDGNYLLNDIFYLTPENDIILNKKNIILCELVYAISNKKTMSLQIIMDDLSSNVNSYDLSFITRLFIYSKLFDKIDNEETLHVKKLVFALLNKNRISILKMSLQYLETYLESDCVIFSRFNLLKSHTEFSYTYLITSAKNKKSSFKDILNMLDVFS